MMLAVNPVDKWVLDATHLTSYWINVIVVAQAVTLHLRQFTLCNPS
jgi:hypothetical protein